jgi:hypothetical protein
LAEAVGEAAEDSSLLAEEAEAVVEVVETGMVFGYGESSVEEHAEAAEAAGEAQEH